MLRRVFLFILPFMAAADQEPEGRDAFIKASFAYHEQRYDDCVSGYQKTIALHHEVPFSAMMIARCSSLKGDAEKAIVALEQAAELEFPNAQLLQNSEEFETVRQHPRFPEVLAKVRLNARPCPQGSRRTQFNFWIGVWQVTNQGGDTVGTDVIDATEDGCLLRESWTGAAGGTGKSVSYYDRLTGWWRQSWMDPSGIGQDMYGEQAHGALVFRQVTYNGGLKTILSVSYAPQANGTVRQLTQRSIDDGVTWTSIADYTFTRQPE